ncbi:MAG: aminoacyl-tRNA hydrolase [Methylobacterium mesophilicum]|nr:aminoacyl-tRNA hydrolase [Methylobacterium mesophilicum]
MLVWAGLGNPGRQHAGQRHNIGFMAVDRIASRHGFAPWSRKFSAEIAEGRIGGQKILLLKPQSFMNLSGQPVGEALRFFKLDTSALTVFYDELDLAPGKVRVKRGGGAGGHNGIRSIDGHCGQDYRRVRLGIGHPGAKHLVTPHVLGDFAKAEAEWLDPLLDALSDAAPLLASGDEAGFMNKISVATGQGDKPPPAPKPAKAQSHIRQARQQQAPKLPETGPMAAMLRKLMGKE